MMLFIIIVGSLSITLTSFTSGNPLTCDESKCVEIPNHYLELGCKAIKANEADCCPSHFECPDFTEYNQGKCQFNGKSYRINEKLPNTIDVGCRASCTCTGNSNETASFNCADIDCPEHFSDYDSNCIRQYDLKQCCATKVVCEKEKIDKLSTCHFEDKMYYEGQAIYPTKVSQKCYKCICDKEFNNKTIVEKNPSCSKITCGLELSYLKYIQMGCAPIYYGNNRCCPFEWKCPKEDDVIRKLPTNSRTTILAINDDPNSVCNYGNETLQTGESVVTNDKCLICSCIVPPMIHCTKDPNCNDA